MENKHLTVTALNKYIGYKFDTDIHLQNVLVKGEISNFRISNGHLYFSLKDEESEIRAIMFAGAARSLRFVPTDGMKVLVTAQVSVYLKGGSYNLNVSKIEEIGLGELYLRFLQLKDKLDKEGLFDQSKKKQIPEYVKSISVITSETGDAFKDIVSTIQKRFPLTKVYLYPTLVQGMEAPKSIIKALNKANKDKLGDVILLARGGGSFEDLNCFNDEQLARVIFSSDIPVVTGIGHEADFTISDFVSDKRAPTPTGAAVLVTKDQYLIAKDLNEKNTLLKYYYKKILEQKFYELQSTINRHYFKNFIDIIEQKEKQLDNLIYNLNIQSPIKVIEKNLEYLSSLNSRLVNYNIVGKIEEKEKYILDRTRLVNNYYLQIINRLEISFENNLSKMIAINPLNLLKKGYALTYQDNKLITNVEEVNISKEIMIKYHDGEVITKPINKKKMED